MESLSYLKPDDFEFSVHQNNGFSGDMYLAHPIDKLEKQYLVKHTSSKDACNELIFSRFAGALGLSVPECRLFEVSASDKRFASPYVVGIEYFPNASKPSLKEILVNDIDIYQYVLAHIVHIFFGNDDTLQFLQTSERRLVNYDFGEAFCISDLVIRCVCHFSPEENPLIRDFLQKLRSPELSPYIFYLDTLMAKMENANVCSSDQFNIVLRDFWGRFLEIDEHSAKMVYEELAPMYPRCIIDYYAGYMSRIREYCGSHTDCADEG